MTNQMCRSSRRALAALMVGVSVAAWSPAALGQAGEAKAPAQASASDILIFRNGTVLTGTIVSETPGAIRFKGVTNGIAFEVDYQRSEILEVKRGAAKVAGEAAKDEAKAEALPATYSKADPADSTPVDPSKTRVYWVDLEGQFGVDISQKPIREAMKDALKNKADVVVMYLNADWYQTGDEFKFEELPDDAGAFDQLFRAEDILPIFYTEMPTEWPKMPRIVFWVRRAMGGSAFLPLIAKEIYFTPDGRLGGVGNLSFMLKGHERVVQKQISLRLQHAVGWANTGGYPEELVRAMCNIEYVLSVKMVGGKPVFYERMPENADEELLTDSGENEFADTVRERVTGDGNDVLTLDARRANLVGVSKGVATDRTQLMAALGLERTGVIIEGRSKQIMKGWSRDIENAKKRVLKLFEEYGEVQVDAPGGYDERTRARGTRINKLEQIKRVLESYREGIDNFWRFRNRIPPIDVINSIIEQLRIEQLRDRP